MLFYISHFSSKQNYADLASPLSLIFYFHFLERAHTLAYCEGQEALKSWRSFRLQQAVAIPQDTVQDFFCKVDMKPHTYASSGNHHVRPVKMGRINIENT